MLLYFTSGTTAKPKLVRHSQRSYPVGHLSTMYWIGLQPGDVHLNISSPGWAKHAWSCFFAPWIAEATIFVYNYARFDAAALLEQLRRAEVNTFCAPPTVWRMLIQADLGALSTPPRVVVGAGDPAECVDDRACAAGAAARCCLVYLSALRVVSLRVVLLPVPQVTAHIVQRSCGLEAQLTLSECRVGR